MSETESSVVEQDIWLSPVLQTECGELQSQQRSEGAAAGKTQRTQQIVAQGKLCKLLRRDFRYTHCCCFALCMNVEKSRAVDLYSEDSRFGSHSAH